MLTVDYDLLDLRPGMRVLDLGCGEGRHAFEAYRRGADVVAVDWGVSEVETTK
ncbi:MAG: methyltransferase domain-containing protein, partial [Blastococcus sp.]|nr:methyltransferase domain-containing protein [Blastococcus sp.]MBJ7454401.1 methyltransferase domain-containing protein [Blastococcus sp.]